MSITDIYCEWRDAALSAPELAELVKIAGDAREQADRFGRALDFGTAGLRGLVGMGTNRMNTHTVRQAAWGFGMALRQSFDAPRACICYDARHDSRAFANECAAVLAGLGVAVSIFDEPRPTPQLSFAIRHFGLDGGINITASHNPKGYSGFKAYWRGGAQLTQSQAELVAGHMLSRSPFACVPEQGFDEALADGKITRLGRDIDELFISACLDCTVDRAAARQAADMKIVYTAFHGVGGAIMPRVLAAAGFVQIECVAEQIEPDGDFPTLDDPNPENPSGFELAVRLAQKVGAHVIIGTDPDADRVAALAPDNSGRWTPITGSQMGALLLDYIISAKRRTGTLPAQPALVQTIVTGGLSLEIARQNGVLCAQTFTGFRFMAEKVEQLAVEGIEYLLAYEEAIGYMAGPHVRDKDGITAGMLIAEMAAWRHMRGESLIDALDGLWDKYGSFAEGAAGASFPGPEGGERMQRLMSNLRANPPRELCGRAVREIEDYWSGLKRDLASGAEAALENKGMDVLIFRLEGGSAIIIRPSGTEPKVKAYVHVKAETPAEAAGLVRLYEKEAARLLR